MADQTDINLVSPNEVEDPWGNQPEGTTKNGDNTAVNAWDSSDPALQNSDQEWLS